MVKVIASIDTGQHRQPEEVAEWSHSNWWVIYSVSDEDFLRFFEKPSLDVDLKLDVIKDEDEVIEDENCDLDDSMEGSASSAP